MRLWTNKATSVSQHKTYFYIILRKLHFFFPAKITQKGCNKLGEPQWDFLSLLCWGRHPPNLYKHETKRILVKGSILYTVLRGYSKALPAQPTDSPLQCILGVSQGLLSVIRTPPTGGNEEAPEGMSKLSSNSWSPSSYLHSWNKGPSPQFSGPQHLETLPSTK